MTCIIDCATQIIHASHFPSIYSTCDIKIIHACMIDCATQVSSLT